MVELKVCTHDTHELKKEGGDFSVISEYLIFASRQNSSLGLTDMPLENAFFFFFDSEWTRLHLVRIILQNGPQGGSSSAFQFQKLKHYDTSM